MQTQTTAADVAREVRAELGRQRISAAALGRKLGKSQSYWSRRINGAIPFNVDELRAIAQLLGVPLHQLIPGLAS